MSSILMALLLVVMQFVAGFGLLTLCRILLRPALFFSLSVLMGIAIFSFIPFLLELMLVPLTSLNIFLALITSCLLLNIKIKRGWQQLKELLGQINFNTRLYELPFFLVTGFILFVSVWRCFYLPPTSRDLTSGPEVIAEYAIREQSMINSVFSVNLETTNNQFKSTFITSLQIIYKYAGFPFGQVWLSGMVICFTVFLYHALSQNIHRLLAGSLMVAFVAIPEMYAYTFMVLYDYSNAVYFFLACWFVSRFFKSGDQKDIAFAGLLMGIATYIRSETLLLAGMLSIAIVWHHIRNRHKLIRLIVSGSYFLLPAVILYFLSVTLYINYYLPVRYDIGGLMNPELSNLRPLLDRFLAINSNLIFSAGGIVRYAYFIYIFLFILIT
ncbi:MAG: hypothetical protein WCF67_03730, partial [Chitinophagaceae bacterium]